MTVPRDLLMEGLEELGIQHTEKQIQIFIAYLKELKKWNKTYNLTALTTDQDIIVKHFIDSILFLKVLPESVHSITDIGSGAGFPGIPLKIMLPNVRVSLIEPTQKKAIFLRHLYHKLSLQNIQVIDKRIEDVTGLKTDAAVTRALFSIEDFIRKAKGILNENGVLILSKGPGIEEELKRIDREKVSINRLELPILHITRQLVVVKGDS